MDFMVIFLTYIIKVDNIIYFTIVLIFETIGKNNI
jgi:hypothetical protein